MALVRTDYGLIYNTDGSLCATLLPEGGVAVTEGTTNIAHGKIIYDTTPPVPVPGYPNALAKYTTATSDLVMTLDPEVQAHSVQAWVYMAEDWDYMTWEFRFLRNGSIVEMIPADPTKKGQWQHVKGTFTGSADQVQLRSKGSGTHRGRWTAMVQIEEKPYDTPFVEGTRPAGILPYPELAKQFNQREFTFTAWWKPYSELGTHYERFFQVDIGTSEAGKRITVWRNPGDNRIRLVIPNSNGTEDRIYSIIPNPYLANTWHFVAFVLDVPNLKARIHLNDEYQESTLSEIPTMLDLQRFFLGCVGTGGQLNGELKNVLLRPYAVSPETIATWHSLDAPFYDPREQIDAGARPVYAPGVIIDSTGAWGIANGVKQAGFGTDGKWYAAGGNIIADYNGMRFIGELGPAKPMIELDRVTGKGRFRGEVAGSIVAWDEQMDYVTTEAFRQVNCSQNCRAIGQDDESHKGYSQVNTSHSSTAGQRCSQINASGFSEAYGVYSQINASNSCDILGNSSFFNQINASMGSIIDTGSSNSQINGDYYSTIKADASQINVSSHCEIISPEGFGLLTHCQINASERVANKTSHSIAGGYASGGAARTSNRKWHIFSNPGSGPTIQIATSLQNNVTFTDYGEFFESVDGQEIPTGYIVTLEGDKIRKATSTDDYLLGVISKTAGIILGAAGLCWQGRFLRGEFGEILTQEIPDPNWQPGEGQTEADRPMITIEVENPEYDPEREYIERAKRPEWHVVGLLGQVHVRVDTTVQAGDYIKSNDEGIGTKDETRTGWRVMKITTPYNEEKGYGVAIVLVR